MLALTEDGLARADQYGKDIEIEHVEQEVLQQCLSEETMAQDEKITAVLLLEFGHLRHNVATHDGRIVPIGALQLGRKHILADRSETRGVGVGLFPPRPRLRKHLVRGSAPQYRVAGREDAQPLPQIGVVIVVPKPHADGIVRHDAVYRNQTVSDDLSHASTPLGCFRAAVWLYASPAISNMISSTSMPAHPA